MTTLSIGWSDNEKHFKRGFSWKIQQFYYTYKLNFYESYTVEALYS